MSKRQTTLEIEAKFTAPDAETLERLAEVGDLTGYTVAGGDVAEMIDAYLDTTDRALSAAGLMCRRRDRGDRILIAVKRQAAPVEERDDAKGDDAVHRREEYEFELPPGMAPEAPPEDWPIGPARDLVVVAAGKQPLATVAEACQRRLLRTVSKDDREVAELSLDTFVIIVHGEELVPQYEVEIELKSAGAETDLTAIADELRRTWGLTSQPLSKYERALAAIRDDRRGPATAGGDTPPPVVHDTQSSSAAPARPGIVTDDTMVEACFKTLRFHFARMLAHEPGTRAGADPEDLHDMRVATRRMRAALRVFAPYLDAGVTKPVERGLRRTGRTLGAVRDLDVFHEKTQRYLATLPEAQRGDLEPLLDVWGRRYEQAPRPHRVAHVLPAVLYDRAAAVWAYDDVIGGADTPLVRFHRLRIAGKAMRYTFEFFEEVMGAKAKPLIKATKDMQDHLGDLQDAVVSCTILRNFLTWGDWEPPDHARQTMTMVVAPGVATYLATRQDELHHLVDTFPETWTAIRGESFSTRLAQVAGSLCQRKSNARSRVGVN